MGFDDGEYNTIYNTIMQITQYNTIQLYKLMYNTMSLIDSSI